MAVTSPPPPFAPGLPDFLARAEVLLGVWPEVRLTSWWRSLSHNRAVGGHPQSRHLTGLAFDAVLPRRFARAFLSDVRWVGLSGLDEGDHIHVQVHR